MQQNAEASKAGHMLIALSLLPAEQIVDGVGVVKLYVQQNNLEEEFRDILDYIGNYWLLTVGVNTMSVADQPHRTNNALEGFYSRLMDLMGAHPGVWKFHDHLRDIEMTQWLEYSRMVGGIQHVRTLPRAYRRQNAVIFESTTHLRQQHYSVAEFLSRVSHLTSELNGRLHRGAAQAGQPAEVVAAEPIMPPPDQQAEAEQQSQRQMAYLARLE